MLTSMAFALGAALTVVAAKRLSGSLVIGIVAALFEIAIFPRGYAYPAVLLYAAAPLVIWWYQDRAWSLARMLALAVFVQIAFLFRHDHGLFIGAGAVVAAAVGDGGATSVRNAFRRVAMFALLALAAAVPFVVYVSLSGGVVRYFSEGLAFSRAEAADNHLVLPPFGPGLGLETNSEAFLFFLFYVLPFAVAAVIAVVARDRARRAAAARA